MYSLRPYQKECVDAISSALRTTDRALVVLPTSAGKTLIFTEFLKLWERPGRKFIVVVNRTELVEQTYRRFKEVFSSVSVWSAGFGEKSLDGNVIIASIQSLNNVTVPNLACIIFDEVHNFGSMDGRYGAFLDRHPDAKVIGFTATPWNNNRPIYGAEKFFPDVSFSIPIEKLIDDGYIIRPIFKAPPHQFDTSKLRTRLGEYVTEDVELLTMNVEKSKAQVEDALGRLHGRKKILWVCASIKHARLLHQLITTSGEKAAIIYSKQNKTLQAIQRNLFEKKDARHMCCVMMGTEGYDFPEIDAVCFMRPTKSAVLFTQVIGRALRLSPDTGKKDALVLDYGRAVENCGPLGNPACIVYGPEKLKKDAVKSLFWCCKNCMSYVKVEHNICQDCGYEREVEKRDDTKNLTTRAAFVEIAFGMGEGAWRVTGIDLNAHVARSSKNRTVRITWHLEGRAPHDEYITENMWRFKHKDFYKLTGMWSEYFDVVYNKLEKGEEIPKKKSPHAIMLKKNDKGFSTIKHLDEQQFNRVTNRAEDTGIPSAY